MWLILKAELAYVRNGLLIGFSIAVCFLLGALIFNAWSGLGFMLNTSIIYFISIGTLGSEADKEKRTRLHASLPIQPRQIGWAEQSHLLFFQLAMIVLWLIHAAATARSIDAEMVASMLSVTGLLLAGINVFVAHTHLKFWGSKLFRWITFIALFLLIFLIFITIWLGSISTIWRFVTGLFFSIPGGLFFILLYLAMAATSIAVLARRKSFLA